MPHAGYAQVLYGSLTGNVTDQSGAAVAGAKVEALNMSTNVSKDTTTDERGVYLLSDLQPGVYRLTIEATSAKTVVQKDIRIDANTARRLDGQLQASGVSETLEVTARRHAQTERAESTSPRAPGR
jgi:hypothetical protein